MSVGGLSSGLRDMRHDRKSYQIIRGRGSISPQVLPKSLELIHGEMQPEGSENDLNQQKQKQTVQDEKKRRSRR